MRRFIENIKIAFHSLFLNKTRSFLTMLGIIIGVGAVVAMLSIGTGAQESVISSVQDIGSNLIIITPGNPEEEEQMMGPQMMFAGDTAELGPDDVKSIERNAELVTEVAPVVFGGGVVSYLNKNTQPQIYSSTENGLKLYNMEIERGNFYNRGDVSSSSNVAVIGQTVLRKLFFRGNYR